MFRASLVTRRVSAFSIYLKDLGRQGKLAGKSTNITKLASKGYRNLSAAERAALNKRAERMSYPALDAYNRFQKEYAHRFTHLPNKQRQRKVAALWAELKEKGTVRIPKAPKKPAVKKPAARKVKKTAKAAKAAKATKASGKKTARSTKK